MRTCINAKEKELTGLKKALPSVNIGNAESINLARDSLFPRISSRPALMSYPIAPNTFIGKILFSTSQRYLIASLWAIAAKMPTP